MNQAIKMNQVKANGPLTLRLAQRSIKEGRIEE